MFPGNSGTTIVLFLLFVVVAGSFGNLRKEKILEYKRLDKQLELTVQRLESLNSKAVDGES